MKMWIAVAI
ncbi:Protein of unknown function [Bacillus cereus]|uniref:Uncharacterized protein n=2 Tax=Bacillus cereus group TaxID=86661 RepID=A0A1C4EAG4_BACTU|nr:Protein of unknown function [Bacillus thuringiensis]SCC42306.1 Protein of unknown function [Bacillus cereus]SCC46004.1 Protein of unknown function [Bacillus wiedmannii]SCN08580.1 Protein of unknown function [Bacillus wiedmannii]SCN34669.1 Protein of unknown function [Bacillus wiedmannii]